MRETTYIIPGCPLDFALLADLHNSPYEAVIASLKRHRPQMIAIAGDVIYGKRPDRGLLTQAQKNVLPFLHACSTVAPTFLSLGNHEAILCDQDLNQIRSAGAVILDNEYTQQGGAVIGGLTSGYVLSYREFRAACSGGERYPRRARPEEAGRRLPDTGWLRGFAQVPGYHILLCHHPEYYKYVPPGIELVLSGHAHGGQWNYYSFREHRWKGVFAPGQGIFPAYTSGVYDGRLIVSRGLSNPAQVPRIFNPTEVVYVQGGRNIRHLV